MKRHNYEIDAEQTNGVGYVAYTLTLDTDNCACYQEAKDALTALVAQYELKEAFIDQEDTSGKNCQV